MQKIILPIMAVVILAVLITAGLMFGKGNGSGSVSSVTGDEVKLKLSEAVGKQAPDFALQDTGGSSVRLSELKGKNVVLFFSAGLTCYPACVDQMVELGKDGRFNNDGVISYSIIIDTQKNWDETAKQLPYLASAKTLLDGDKAVSNMYDVFSARSVMHGQPGHTYFIIDKEGIIRYMLDDPYMGIRNNELFAELQKI